MMKIYTIGFTKKSAEDFFALVSNSGIKRLIDVRLNNVSQLSGFAKKNDLAYFLRSLCGVDYVHSPDLAPTKELLKLYKNGDISWVAYEDRFLNLMAQRNVEREINIQEKTCLLCSEHKPHFCHRRLVVEYLNKFSESEFTVEHLL